MQWFFVEDKQRVGPVEDRDFEEFVRSGRVGAETLVWNAGMTAWAPLREVRPGMPGSEEPASAPAPPPPSAPGPAGPRAPCGVCGQMRDPEDLMSFRDTRVCPDCKPAFVQRLREGTGQPGEFRYAGFWIRAGAKLIDSVILAVVSIVLTFLSGFALAGMMQGAAGGPDLGLLMAVQGGQTLLQVGVQAAFVTYFLSRHAATPGKMATGLVVIRPDGGRLTAGRALGRFFGEWLSGITIGIGYLMAAFDQERRALHDRVCDTRVVYKSSAVS